VRAESSFDTRYQQSESAQQVILLKGLVSTDRAKL